MDDDDANADAAAVDVDVKHHLPDLLLAEAEADFPAGTGLGPATTEPFQTRVHRHRPPPPTDPLGLGLEATSPMLTVPSASVLASASDPLDPLFVPGLESPSPATSSTAKRTKLSRYAQKIQQLKEKNAQTLSTASSLGIAGPVAHGDHDGIVAPLATCSSRRIRTGLSKKRRSPGGKSALHLPTQLDGENANGSLPEEIPEPDVLLLPETGAFPKAPAVTHRKRGVAHRKTDQSALAFQNSAPLFPEPECTTLLLLDDEPAKEPCAFSSEPKQKFTRLSQKQDLQARNWPDSTTVTESTELPLAKPEDTIGSAVQLEVTTWPEQKKKSRKRARKQDLQMRNCSDLEPATTYLEQQECRAEQVLQSEQVKKPEKKPARTGRKQSLRARNCPDLVLFPCSALPIKEETIDQAEVESPMLDSPPPSTAALLGEVKTNYARVDRKRSKTVESCRSRSLAAKIRRKYWPRLAAAAINRLPKLENECVFECARCQTRISGSLAMLQHAIRRHELSLKKFQLLRGCFLVRLSSMKCCLCGKEILCDSRCLRDHLFVYHRNLMSTMTYCEQFRHELLGRKRKDVSPLLGDPEIRRQVGRLVPEYKWNPLSQTCCYQCLACEGGGQFDSYARILSHVVSQHQHHRQPRTLIKRTRTRFVECQLCLCVVPCDAAYLRQHLKRCRRGVSLRLYCRLYPEFLYGTTLSRLRPTLANQCVYDCGACRWNCSGLATLQAHAVFMHGAKSLRGFLKTYECKMTKATYVLCQLCPGQILCDAVRLRRHLNKFHKHLAVSKYAMHFPSALRGRAVSWDKGTSTRINI